jgi:hypothetical protein
MAELINLRRERCLLSPPAEHRWWRSHAQLPTVLPLNRTCWRIFFAGRDADNRSHILYADLDPSRDLELIRLHSEPLLELGPPGSFDSAGTGPSMALLVRDRIFLYYVGISLRQDVPYQQAIGLAISDDGGATFHRAAAGPVLSVGPFDPYFTSIPHVSHAGGAFRMHYVSAFAWDQCRDQLEVRYHIKHARSSDGIVWMTEERTALAVADEAEAATARPWVVRRHDGWHMWFCCRGWRNSDGIPVPPYRLGYAHSADGVTWRRHPELVRYANPPQSADWDCEMQAYPCVVSSGSSLLVFYNGNGFGRSGFGFARILK